MTKTMKLDGQVSQFGLVRFMLRRGLCGSVHAVLFEGAVRFGFGCSGSVLAVWFGSAAFMILVCRGVVC